MYFITTVTNGTTCARVGELEQEVSAYNLQSITGTGLIPSTTQTEQILLLQI
ncbi:hypothetical protein [Arenibacter aquaticus]|uniref:hypothetical protein n=1 Tax=Arenibacter aquaticus TaxID=2489054 RepID=UPI001EE44F2A|nr:hypothetical protein [Arenibacter aquaticus]